MGADGQVKVPSGGPGHTASFANNRRRIQSGDRIKNLPRQPMSSRGRTDGRRYTQTAEESNDRESSHADQMTCRRSPCPIVWVETMFRETGAGLKGWDDGARWRRYVTHSSSLCTSLGTPVSTSAVRRATTRRLGTFSVPAHISSPLIMLLPRRVMTTDIDLVACRTSD